MNGLRLLRTFLSDSTLTILQLFSLVWVFYQEEHPWTGAQGQAKTMTKYE